MKHLKLVRTSCFVIAILTAAALVRARPETDPLPSWNDTAPKKAILAFVDTVTNERSAGFVPVGQRIATFDNDGTLWTEQPMYAQMAFVNDRVHELAPAHPEWRTSPGFRAMLEGDPLAVFASDEKGLMQLMAVMHAGTTVDQFHTIVTGWLATAEHPRFHRPYTECVYQPMLELLAFLRAKGFQTFLVSGGGVEFMRGSSESTYGIVPQNVVGSSIRTRLEMINGKPELMRLAEINFIDDHAGKPAAIQQYIGRRPIAAFGNSDGDLQMLEWTAAGGGPRLMLIVHHTDPLREYAYDRESAVGRLDKALDEANARGWTVVDMRNDWRTIFPSRR